jgi:stage III sporulation protein AG
MEWLKKLNSKNMIYFLAVLVGFGVILLLAQRFVGEPENYIRDAFSKYATEESYEPPPSTPMSFDREHLIEARLEEFFSMVENAGTVRVMVSLLGNRETVFAVDKSGSRSYSTEQDAQGGTRETHNYQSAENTVIITNRQGADTPLVLREIEPRIEGIVIIAEGGDCPFVRDALTRAARAVLGLEAHMVQVLTMKT